MIETNRDAVFNLEYNAERPHLIIPEYGRHIQKLIDLTKAITDRDERNKAANQVIKIMGTMNPHLRDVPDFQHKLWDQLFVMANFELDVDSPYAIPTADVINQKPDPLDYPQNFPKYRYYGNNITYMIDVAIGHEEGEMKDALVLVIANHMKKCYLSWNKETVEDDVIFEHLAELSDGKINLFKSNESLTNSHNLLRVNKKQSNKTAFSKPAVKGKLTKKFTKNKTQKRN